MDYSKSFSLPPFLLKKFLLWSAFLVNNVLGKENATQWNISYWRKITAQKMKFSIKDFFSICDQIHSFLRIWSHLLKKSSMENFIFCAVNGLKLKKSLEIQLKIEFLTPNNGSEKCLEKTQSWVLWPNLIRRLSMTFKLNWIMRRN